MQALFYYDLSEHDLYTDLDGTPVDWWEFIVGDKLYGGLRFVQQANGETVEVDREVTLLKVSLGLVDARPEAGTFSLQIGPDPATEDNTTATLAWNDDADAVQTAINATDLTALGLENSEVELVGDSWLVVFPGAESPVEIKAASNKLRPFAFVDVRAWQLDGEWVHEIRLVQTPYAFTDQTARVVPPPPTVTRISAGGANESMSWPEIQELYVPPTFAGGYILRLGDLRSDPLSVEDDAEDIAAAIEPLADEDGGELSVEFVRNNVVQIVFEGTMRGTAYDLLEVEVISAPEGDHSFELDLDDAAAWNALRAVAEIECVLSFEIRYQDPDDAEITRRSKYQTEVTLVRSQIRDSLSTAPGRDWLRPPLPVSYLPYDEGQIITGNQSAEVPFPESGNEGLLVQVIDHGLETEAVHLTIRENVSPGDVLTPGIDYTWQITGEDSITITMLETGYGAPVAAEELVALITSVGPVSAFLAHQHEIANINSLRDELDALAGAIAAIQLGLPTGALTLPEATATGYVWRIPPLFKILPLTKQVDPASRPESLADLDLEAALPRIGSTPKALSKRGGGLLPAVHDAAAESMLALPLPTVPDAAHVGRVFENDTDDEIYLDGGGGRRGVALKPGQFMAADDRYYYRVTRPDDGENSWYPADFDLVLAEFFVTAQQLRLRTTFEMQVGFELMLAYANTKAQWALVAEVGALSEEAEPATTGINIKKITWDTANPRLYHRIPVTDTPQGHTFGLRVQRYMSTGEDPEDTMTLDAILYGAAIGGDAPPSNNFAVRLRLAEFDVEDDVENPSGYILLNGLAVNPDGTGQANDALGVARILV